LLLAALLPHAALALCYFDEGPTGSNITARQMKHQVCEVTGPLCSALSRAGCAAACKRLGFALFGVAAGHQW